MVIYILLDEFIICLLDLIKFEQCLQIIFQQFFNYFTRFYILFIDKFEKRKTQEKIYNPKNQYSLINKYLANSDIERTQNKVMKSIEFNFYLGITILHQIWLRCTLKYKNQQRSNNQLYMQTQNSQNSDYSSLQPRQKNRSDGSFKRQHVQKFCSNYFPLRIKPQISMVYQYDYKLYLPNNNQVEKNSRLYKKFIKQHKKKLEEVLGFEMQSGQIVYCLKNQPITTIKWETKGEDQALYLSAVFKQIKVINIKDLILHDASIQQKKHILQLLDIKLKNLLECAGMRQLGKSGKYFSKDTNFLNVQGRKKNELQISKGYYLTIIPWNKTFVVQVDVCFRVLQAQHFIQEIIKMRKDGCNNQQINQKFIGQTLTAKYGNFKNYKIIKIDFTKNPQSKFIQSNGIEISYMDYYLNHHKIKIKDNRQPLVEVVLRTQNTIGKDGKIQKKTIKGYLVPQLVSLAGIKDQQKQQMSIMKSMGQITKMKPQQRIVSCKEIVKKLNKNSNWIKIGEQQLQLQGFVMKTPTLRYGQRQVKPDQKGRVKDLGKLQQPAVFKDYLFVYSFDNKQKIDRNKKEAQEAVQLLDLSSKIYGVRFMSPCYLPIDSKSNLDEWISIIQQDCRKNNNPQIIIFFITQYQTKYYDRLKQFCTNQLNCHSQVIRRQTFRNQKKRKSAASKLVIQMNSKIGLPVWRVQKSHPFFVRQKAKVMYCGITISKTKKGTFLSFVGSIRDNNTKFCSFCKQIKNQTNISISSMTQIFIEWAKSFYKNQKCVPDYILIYVQGFNQRQAARQLNEVLVPALKQMIMAIGKNTKTVNYSPKFQFVTVNKKINSRFFRQKQYLDNPMSGSFVIQNMEESCSFQLVPQFVNSGTATPTKFTIMNQNSGVPNQVLISFTYEQCFNYYNWEGAVRVPACLQYAHKLAKFVSQHIGVQNVSNTFRKTLFYL